MKTPHALRALRRATFLFCAACLALFGTAQADVPSGLILTRGAGNIILDGSSPAPYQIRTSVAETSSGGWKGPRNKEKIEAQSGTQIERNASYEFPDGSIIKHTLVARIEGKAVDVKASWEVDGNPPGFSRVDFWLPGSEAETTTITIDGKEVWKDGKPIFAGTSANPGEIVGKRSSDGRTLFRITGELVGTSVAGSADRPEQGATIRIFPVQNANKALIGDVKSQNWRVEFPED